MFALFLPCGCALLGAAATEGEARHAEQHEEAARRLRDDLQIRPRGSGRSRAIRECRPSIARHGIYRLNALTSGDDHPVGAILIERRKPVALDEEKRAGLTGCAGLKAGQFNGRIWYNAREGHVPGIRQAL